MAAGMEVALIWARQYWHCMSHGWWWCCCTCCWEIPSTIRVDVSQQQTCRHHAGRPIPPQGMPRGSGVGVPVGRVGQGSGAGVLVGSSRQVGQGYGQAAYCEQNPSDFMDEKARFPAHILSLLQEEDAR